MFKTIDKLLFKAMILPFFWTFGVAVFVLLMQMMWLYIDDIIGKGISHWIILEVIIYLSIALFPLAFPIGILMACIMVMGNLAERYELSSLKSAGTSLTRVMRPLFIFTFIVAAFSLYCSHSLIPVSNLKYRSRMFDIKKQKPALNLEEGVFNYDFKNLVIYVNEKNEEADALKKVMIYDHKNDNKKYSSTMADSGRIMNAGGGQYLLMELYDGHQFTQGSASEENPYPFVRINFKAWNRIFDLSEFDLKATDENIFKSHRQMLSLSQLNNKIDTIELNYSRLQSQFDKYVKGKLNFYLDYSDLVKKDSVRKAKEAEKYKVDASTKSFKNKPPKNAFEQLPREEIVSVKSMIETFNKKDRRRIEEKVYSELRGMVSQAGTAMRNLRNEKRHFEKYIYEYHNRYATAVICIVFFLIGAPLGAIIRKGGFGYPMLLAIIFFVAYIMTRIMFEKLVKEALINPIWAAWAPVAFLLPVGIFLTYMALNDKKLLQLPAMPDWLERWIKGKNLSSTKA